VPGSRSAPLLDKKHLMKYSIYIDVIHSTEWQLSVSEAVVFSYLSDASGWASTMVMGTEVWYHVSRGKFIQDVPFLTNKPDTIYRIYRKLQEKGLIEAQKVGPADFIKLTDKGKAWGKKQIRDSEKNPSETGNISENTSEKNPTYNTISINNTNSNKGDLPQEEVLISDAIKACKDYFDEWSGFRETLIIQSGVTKKEFDEELEKWVRHKVDQPQVISSPTKYLHKTFLPWLKRSKSFTNSKIDSPATYDGSADKMK